jgi:hypothetical protein
MMFSISPVPALGLIGFVAGGALVRDRPLRVEG